MANILVIGTGTIGSPLTRMFSRHMDTFGLSRVLMYKHSPRREDVANVKRHLESGAELVVDEAREAAFTEIGLPSSLYLEEAIEQVDVVIDCSGNARSRLDVYRTASRPILFVSQGSEDIGAPYAFGINHQAAAQESFRQVVSCNTHAISSLVNTLGFTDGASRLERAEFMLLRRDNDDSQTSGAIHGVEVGEPRHDRFGSHHAADAHRVFRTLDHDLSLYSRAMKTPQPFMHVVHFEIHLTESTTRDEVVSRLRDNPLIATTMYRHNNQVSSVGREWGSKGRIFNHVVVSLPTLAVQGNVIEGSAFTPQDGNSLLSSVAIAMQYLHPEDWQQRMAEPISQYTFQEI